MALRKMVWEARFKAHVNARYFAKVGSLWGAVERAISFLIAISASAAVAKWKFWTAMPGSFDVLMSTAAVLSIFNAVFQLPTRIATLTELQSKWLEQRNTCDLAWAKLEEGGKTTPEQVEALKRPEAEMQKLEAKFWTFSYVIRAAEDEVCDLWKIPRRPR